TVITLDPAIFNEEEGYYVAWERCCRNYTITNIFSEDPAPQNGGIAAGQTFLLDFPPVVKNGQPFINSSPRLFPPLNDYACPNRPYYVDFAGIDDDGDSLVYSLTTPLNTHSAVALPALQPRPYPPVEWRDGFNINHVIGGNPDLKISRDGLLTATPLIQGLFVFAVKVEEYRNKELIGVSRRDFQMLVVDGCADAVPPEITGPTNVNLSYTMTGDDRCITVTVSDADSQKSNHNFTEKVRIRAVGLNFANKNLTEILPDDVTETLVNGSTADFNICFPVCPFFIGGPYQVGIIAMDDACSLPLLDTLKITVNVEPPPNTDPYFTDPDPVQLTLNEGFSSDDPSLMLPADFLTFEVRDNEADNLLVSVLTDGFVLNDAGIFYTVDEEQPGLVQGHLKWDAFCDIYDFTQRTTFKVTIQVDDLDECQLNEPIEKDYNFTVVLPENAPPIIDTSLTPSNNERIVSGVQRRVYEKLTFDVFGEDLVDHDYLVLDLVGIENQSLESLNSLGVLFEKAEGLSAVQSKLTWDITCNGALDLDSVDSFDLQFLVVDDKNKCKIYKADTVEVEVKVLPPPNIGPQLVVNSLNDDVALINNQIEMFRGNQIILGLQGADFDNGPKDMLKLDLIDAKGNVPPSGFVFESAEGEGSVSTTFSWNPDCSIFENGVYENDYTFTFSVNDQRCFNTKADTVEVTMKIKDIDGSDNGFDPINFFTPNDDGFNDYYSMEKLNKQTELLENILPLDNCISQFQAIRIYNRWGKEVFKSTDRDFKWYGKGEAAGVYYYLIKYSNKEYKGALSIRY
ncbi:MAG TPA: gliding motility-associated C-terminal domain-containing protein, partial [Cyclobacteriaceae bacterium]|nr:gliding motility-associated C-terminal domain-containing protein [Cyclobacteriaceae bacterium]